MEIRAAMLKAADQIERAPDSFDFHSSNIPNDKSCGTPGCALGWVAAFRFGQNDTAFWRERSFDLVVDCTAWTFYSRMDDFDADWAVDAARCAAALRAYADKYHA
jgi:hypothetical protein